LRFSSEFDIGRECQMSDVGYVSFFWDWLFESRNDQIMTLSIIHSLPRKSRDRPCSLFGWFSMARRQPIDSLIDLTNSLFTSMISIDEFEPKVWNSPNNHSELNSIFIFHVHGNKQNQKQE
jgi:hypothetical protein